MQDHCEAAMNAKLLAWPGFGFFPSSAVAIRGHFVCLAGIVVNNCYPHAVRMVARATRSRLRNSNNGARLRSHFSMLHALTILAVFQHAMMLFYSFWRTNERAFIEWFEQTYDHDGRWLGWFAGNRFRTQQKDVCMRLFFFLAGASPGPGPGPVDCRVGCRRRQRQSRQCGSDNEVLLRNYQKLPKKI